MFKTRTRIFNSFRPLAVFAFTLALVCLLTARATAADGSDNRIQIRGVGKQQINIAYADPIGSSSYKEALQKEIQRNLSFLPFAVLIPSGSIPGGTALPVANGAELDLKRFQLAGADSVITAQWNSSSQVAMRVFQPYSSQFVFGREYNVQGQDGVSQAAAAFCSDFLENLTGRGDLYRSHLAFIKTSGPRQKDVWTVRPTGGDLRRLSNIKGEAMSPSWSKDGNTVVFTLIEPRTHSLGIWSRATGQATRTQFPGNTVISPCFMPNGKIAVSLTDGKNPSIFLLNSAFQREQKLISSTGIDVSPSIDASGSKMAFTSSRLGNPNVFVQDLRTGTVRRVSQEGKYNSDPCISPDGQAIVYSRMVASGQHRIFSQDLNTGQESQITFGPGSDEQAKFAPDSYFVAFMSTRSGQKKIYLTTRYGGTAKEIPTGEGDASFPAWGIVDRK